MFVVKYGNKNLPLSKVLLKLYDITTRAKLGCTKLSLKSAQFACCAPMTFSTFEAVFQLFVALCSVKKDILL